MAHPVLLVDDEPWALVDLARTFPWEKYGMRVVGQFTRPQEALTSILRLRPAIVCTDIFMPGMTGVELLRRARESEVDSHFIIVSGISDFPSAQEAIRYGAVEYCLKPLEEGMCEALLLRIARMLEPEADQDQAPGSFRQVLDYMKTHLHEKLLLDSVADRFFMSGNTLLKLFRIHLDTTFGQYLEKERMRCACRLLRETDETVQRVAELTGYPDAFYFSRIFKAKHGVTPSQYRRA